MNKTIYRLSVVLFLSLAVLINMHSTWAEQVQVNKKSILHKVPYIQLGACTANDIKIAINPYNSDFASTLNSCATADIANVTETSGCIQEDFPGLSDTCASCFGQVAYCTKENCLWQCIFNHASSDCISCSETNCRNPQVSSFSLEKCTGLTASQLPPAK